MSRPLMSLYYILLMICHSHYFRHFYFQRYDIIMMLFSLFFFDTRYKIIFLLSFHFWWAWYYMLTYFSKMILWDDIHILYFSFFMRYFHMPLLFFMPLLLFPSIKDMALFTWWYYLLLYAILLLYCHFRHYYYIKDNYIYTYAAAIWYYIYYAFHFLTALSPRDFIISPHYYDIMLIAARRFLYILLLLKRYMLSDIARWCFRRHERLARDMPLCFHFARYDIFHADDIIIMMPIIFAIKMMFSPPFPTICQTRQRYAIIIIIMLWYIRLERWYYKRYMLILLWYYDMIWYLPFSPLIWYDIYCWWLFS